MKATLTITLLLIGIKGTFAQIDFDKELKSATRQLMLACQTYNDTVNGFPRGTKDDGTFKGTNRKDWTCGFFSGNLWFALEATGDKRLIPYAKKWTLATSEQQYVTDNQDVGFMIHSSFGNMLKFMEKETCRQVIIQAARSVLTTYNPVIGCTRSWYYRKNGRYSVIIDNMMDLELLFAATKYSGDSTYYKAAVSHATKTMMNHFRPDASSYQVVDYDTLTGAVKYKSTHQGLSSYSAWARGQAWGLYGFVMCYRETRKTEYLEHAKKIASFWMNHKALPSDLVPYWDFNAPINECTPRDASAAAIAASALLELSTFTGDDGDRYKNFAIQTLTALSSPAYKAEIGTNNFFLLKHSVGAYPFNSEIDKPMVYADYYYLEALLRAKNLRK